MKKVWRRHIDGLKKIKGFIGMSMSGLNLYKNKRVLITGHTGFKGAWLSLWLKKLGADVAGYALKPPTHPSFFELVNLKDVMDHIGGDIRDFNKLAGVIRTFKPEFIFHLAAQPLVRLSYKKPKLTYETNVIGTANLLEAARRTDSVRVIIVVTSDKCYDNKESGRFYKEDDPLGGCDPYSSSKACAEVVCMAYKKSFFNPRQYREHGVSLSSVRAGNVIGGGDWGIDRLVPDSVKALSRNRSILIRHPRAIRPWQYVLECLSGYLWLGALMRKDGAKYNGAWNFGPRNDDMISVEKLVKFLISSWGKGSYSVDVATHLQDVHEASFLRLDCAKSKSLLKWAPVYDVRAAVKETVIWYKNYYGSRTRPRMRDFTLCQLDRYIDRAVKNKIPWSNA